jgi:uncharacterized DUF497 family protein
VFDWDGSNIEHVARHGVIPSEAEEALADPRRVRTDAYTMPTERRVAFIGRTTTGRLLYVVLTRRSSMLRVATARDATERETKQYRRKQR